MQTSSVLSPRDRSSSSVGSAPQSGSEGFFNAHPVGEILRSLLLSSVLWVLLGIAIYFIYTMILGLS